MAYRPYLWRKNNPDKRLEQRRREKVRMALRKKGILPPVGEEMNQEQLLINEQIGNNDFSYWDSIKLNKGNINPQLRTDIQPPEYLIWYRTKSKCYEKNIPYEISVEDIFIPEICELTNQVISTDHNDNNNGNYYVLSMIDNSKGYVKGNVKVVSSLGLRNINIQLNIENKTYLNVYDYIPKDIEKSIFDRAKENSKRRGCEFNLEKSDIITPTHCPYLGIELSYNKKDGKLDNYCSIDRIDSSKGYVKGNIQVISHLANTMKSSATTEELITFSKNVLKMSNS